MKTPKWFKALWHMVVDDVDAYEQHRMAEVSRSMNQQTRTDGAIVHMPRGRWSGGILCGRTHGGRGRSNRELAQIITIYQIAKSIPIKILGTKKAGGVPSIVEDVLTREFKIEDPENTLYTKHALTQGAAGVAIAVADGDEVVGDNGAIIQQSEPTFIEIKRSSELLGDIQPVSGSSSALREAVKICSDLIKRIYAFQLTRNEDKSAYENDTINMVLEKVKLLLVNARKLGNNGHYVEEHKLYQAIFLFLNEIRNKRVFVEESNIQFLNISNALQFGLITRDSNFPHSFHELDMTICRDLKNIMERISQEIRSRTLHDFLSPFNNIISRSGDFLQRIINRFGFGERESMQLFPETQTSSEMEISQMIKMLTGTVSVKKGVASREDTTSEGVILLSTSEYLLSISSVDEIQRRRIISQKITSSIDNALVGSRSVNIERKQDLIDNFIKLIDNLWFTQEFFGVIWASLDRLILTMGSNAMERRYKEEIKAILLEFRQNTVSANDICEEIRDAVKIGSERSVLVGSTQSSGLIRRRTQELSALEDNNFLEFKNIMVGEDDVISGEVAFVRHIQQSRERLLERIDRLLDHLNQSRDYIESMDDDIRQANAIVCLGQIFSAMSRRLRGERADIDVSTIEELQRMQAGTSRTMKFIDLGCDRDKMIVEPLFGRDPDSELPKVVRFRNRNHVDETYMHLNAFALGLTHLIRRLENSHVINRINFGEFIQKLGQINIPAEEKSSRMGQDFFMPSLQADFFGFLRQYDSLSGEETSETIYDCQIRIAKTLDHIIECQIGPEDISTERGRRSPLKDLTILAEYFSIRVGYIDKREIELHKAIYVGMPNNPAMVLYRCEHPANFTELWGFYTVDQIGRNFNKINNIQELNDDSAVEGVAGPPREDRGRRRAIRRRQPQSKLITRRKLWYSSAQALDLLGRDFGGDEQVAFAPEITVKSGDNWSTNISLKREDFGSKIDYFGEGKKVIIVPVSTEDHVFCAAFYIYHLDLGDTSRPIVYYIDPLNCLADNSTLRDEIFNLVRNRFVNFELVNLGYLPRAFQSAHYNCGPCIIYTLKAIHDNVEAVFQNPQEISLTLIFNQNFAPVRQEQEEFLVGQNKLACTSITACESGFPRPAFESIESVQRDIQANGRFYIQWPKSLYEAYIGLVNFLASQSLRALNRGEREELLGFVGAIRQCCDCCPTSEMDIDRYIAFHTTFNAYFNAISVIAPNIFSSHENEIFENCEAVYKQIQEFCCEELGCDPTILLNLLKAIKRTPNSPQDTAEEYRSSSSGSFRSFGSHRTSGPTIFGSPKRVFAHNRKKYLDLFKEIFFKYIRSAQAIGDESAENNIAIASYMVQIEELRSLEGVSFIKNNLILAAWRNFAAQLKGDNNFIENLIKQASVYFFADLSETPSDDCARADGETQLNERQTDRNVVARQQQLVDILTLVREIESLPSFFEGIINQFLREFDSIINFDNCELYNTISRLRNFNINVQRYCQDLENFTAGEATRYHSALQIVNDAPLQAFEEAIRLDGIISSNNDRSVLPEEILSQLQQHNETINSFKERLSQTISEADDSEDVGTPPMLPQEEADDREESPLAGADNGREIQASRLPAAMFAAQTTTRRESTEQTRAGTGGTRRR